MPEGESVFNMDTFTVTSGTVPNAGNDNHINIKGSLGNWTSIGTGEFLGQLFPGQEQVYVNGNCCLEVRGERKTLISGSTARDELVVRGDRHTVIGDVDDLEVKGDRKTVVRKNEFRTVNGRSLRDIHSGEFQNEVASWFRSYGTIRFQHGVGDGKLSSRWNVTVQPWKTDLQAWNLNLSAFDTRLAPAEGKIEGAHIHTGLAKIITGGLTNKLFGISE